MIIAYQVHIKIIKYNIIYLLFVAHKYFYTYITTYFQDAYPTNPKEAHLINLHPLIEGVCRLCMTFSNDKMRERTKFYSKTADLSAVCNAVGKDILPEEYGGTNGTMKKHIGK